MRFKHCKIPPISHPYTLSQLLTIILQMCIIAVQLNGNGLESGLRNCKEQLATIDCVPYVLELLLLTRQGSDVAIDT